MEILQRSGILPWNEENINNCPEKTGVYILRNSPVNGGMLLIEKADNLRRSIMEHYSNKIFENISSVEFFDWYETNTDAEAEKLAAMWKEKYSIF